MNERLVLCCWWADGKVAAEQRLLLAERVSEQALEAGGTEIAWGSSSCCFAFEPSALPSALELAQRLIGQGLVEQAAMARRELSAVVSGRVWGPSLVIAEGLAGLADQAELMLDESLQGALPQYFSGTAQRRVVLNGEVVAAGRLLVTADSGVPIAGAGAVGVGSLSRAMGSDDAARVVGAGGAALEGSGGDEMAGSGGVTRPLVGSDDSRRPSEPDSGIPSSGIPSSGIPSSGVPSSGVPRSGEANTSTGGNSASATGAVARSPLPPVPSVPAPSTPAPWGEGFEVAPTIPSVYPSGPPSSPELIAAVAAEEAEAEQRPTNPEVPRPSAPPDSPGAARAVLRAPMPDLAAPRPLRSIGPSNGSLSRKSARGVVGVEPAVRNSTPPPKPTSAGPTARTSSPAAISDAPVAHFEGRATPPPLSPRRRRPSTPSPYPVPDLPRAVVSSKPPPKPRRSQPSTASGSNPPAEGTHNSSKPPERSTPPHSSQPAHRRLSNPPPKPNRRSSLPPPPPKRSRPPADGPAVQANQRTSSNPPQPVGSDRASSNPPHSGDHDHLSAGPADRSSLNPQQPMEALSPHNHDSQPASQPTPAPPSSQPERHSQPPDAAGLWRLREGVSKSRPLGGLLHGHACLSLATGLAKAGRPTEALLEALEALARARDAKNAALERSCVRLLEKFARSAGFDDVAEGWLAVGK